MKKQLSYPTQCTKRKLKKYVESFAVISWTGSEDLWLNIWGGTSGELRSLTDSGCDGKGGGSDSEMAADSSRDRNSLHLTETI